MNNEQLRDFNSSYVFVQTIKPKMRIWIVACGTPASTEKYIKTNLQYVKHNIYSLWIQTAACFGQNMQLFLSIKYICYVWQILSWFLSSYRKYKGENTLRKTHKKFWCQTLRAWDHLKNQRGERRMLKRILKERDGTVCTKFMWLRIWRRGELLWKRWRTLVTLKVLGISWLSQKLLTLQEYSATWSQAVC